VCYRHVLGPGGHNGNKVAYYVIYTSASLESALILKRITARCEVISVSRKQLQAVPASFRHDELRKKAHCCYAVADIQAQLLGHRGHDGGRYRTKEERVTDSRSRASSKKTNNSIKATGKRTLHQCTWLR
jgi:hypothetical protein